MITTLAAPAFGQVFAAGAPAKMLASCEADLNGDKNADLVLQLETVRGPEVIALLTAGDTYRGFIIAKGSGAQLRLRCELGDGVTTTSAGVGNPKPRVVRTPGAYVVLYEPEGAASAYVWTGSKFIEVAIAD